ncbi:MAG: transcriptional repressor LexA [Brockia lithotrophica]|nr:transcriptional repressor LexA [Brockia lithotrophica]
MRGTSESQLTPREREVLDFIRLFFQAHGFPPTVRQIAEGLGLSSTASAHYYLKRLEYKGVIQRLPKRSRSLKLRDPNPDGSANPLHTVGMVEEVREVPLLGYTPAGNPREALEVPEGSMYAPAPFAAQETQDNPLFYLRVRGDSMVGAGIFDGDYVLIRRQDAADEGDIVLALTSDGEATIKRLRFHGRQAVLVAENPEYPPLTDLEFRILGKVVGIFRILA